jgi:hypothetical protein
MWKERIMKVETVKKRARKVVMRKKQMKIGEHGSMTCFLSLPVYRKEIDNRLQQRYATTLSLSLTL